MKTEYVFQDNTVSVTIPILCFDRELEIVLLKKEWYGMYHIDSIEQMMMNNYTIWFDCEDDSCCEEYILSILPSEISENIVCIIYRENEEYYNI